MKVDSVELDIWLTKDKHIIVIHGGLEGNLEQESSPYNHQFFKNLTLDQVKEIRIDGEEIPTLKEVFLKLKETKTTINVEVKERNIEVC